MAIAHQFWIGSLQVNRERAERRRPNRLSNGTAAGMTDISTQSGAATWRNSRRHDSVRLRSARSPFTWQAGGSRVIVNAMAYPGPMQPEPVIARLVADITSEGRFSCENARVTRSINRAAPGVACLHLYRPVLSLNGVKNPTTNPTCLIRLQRASDWSLLLSRRVVHHATSIGLSYRIWLVGNHCTLARYAA